jgi:hypothetical protein
MAKTLSGISPQRAAAGEVGEGYRRRAAFRFGGGDDEQRRSGTRGDGAEAAHHLFDRGAAGEVGDAVDDEDARRPHNPRAERIMLKVPVTAMASRVTMKKFARGSLGGVVMLPVMLGLVFTRESE